jgi:hypothetical protein
MEARNSTCWSFGTGQPIITRGMGRDDELFLVVSHEEAWELMSRCLNSSDPDNDVSKGVLRKLARILQCAQLETAAVRAA